MSNRAGRRTHSAAFAGRRCVAPEASRPRRILLVTGVESDDLANRELGALSALASKLLRAMRESVAPRRGADHGEANVDTS